MHVRVHVQDMGHCAFAVYDKTNRNIFASCLDFKLVLEYSIENIPSQGKLCSTGMYSTSIATNNQAARHSAMSTKSEKSIWKQNYN